MGRSRASQMFWYKGREVVKIYTPDKYTRIRKYSDGTEEIETLNPDAIHENLSMPGKTTVTQHPSGRVDVNLTMSGPVKTKSKAKI